MVTGPAPMMTPRSRAWQLLGSRRKTDPTVMVDGPGPSLCFQHVQQRKYDHNRIHVDIAVSDRRREIDRHRALGASVWREAERYTVMRDLEGNQYCLVEVEA